MNEVLGVKINKGDTMPTFNNAVKIDGNITEIGISLYNKGVE